MLNLKHPALAFLATCLLSTLSGAAFASDYLNLNIGSYNALRTTQNQALQMGAEYRFAEVGYGVRPMVGGFWTTDSAAYGYAGINWDVTLLPKQLYLVPNFAVGAYKEGTDKKLGGPLEFRSGIELDYQFQNEHQVGIVLNHISNASIYKHNSGEESVLVNYSIPVGNALSWWK